MPAATSTIPETMRAAVLRDYDKGLQVETIRMPRPKSGEVLIKVTACGLCHSDLHVIGGAIAFEALGIPSTWNTALDVLADGGCMVPIGLGAGRQNTEVEINRTVRRSQSILGSYGARTRQDLPGRKQERASRRCVSTRSRGARSSTCLCEHPIRLRPTHPGERGSGPESSLEARRPADSGRLARQRHP